MTTYKDVKDIRRKAIFDLLGIEEENRKTSDYLIEEFTELNKKGYNAINIWLRGDAPYYEGKVIDGTQNLVVII